MILTRRHPELTDTQYATYLREHAQMFKKGRILSQKKMHQEVRECSIEGISYIIKRYTSKSPLSIFRLLTNSSRADRSFNFARTLSENGIRTPLHSLVIKHISLLKTTSYLIMEKSIGTEFRQYLQSEANLTLSEKALQNVAQLVQQLQNLKICHGDLHTHNILINPDNTVEIIDLDGMKFSKKGTSKDLLRLKRTLKPTSKYWEAIQHMVDEKN